MEFKSHIGPSFSNNFNNRCEEALGNATDLLTAYREHALGRVERPWLGFVLLLEDTDKVHGPVRPREPHFDVLPEFKATSYCERYRLMLERLRSERLYDGVCLLLSPEDAGIAEGRYSEPEETMSFSRFAALLGGRLSGHLRSH